MKSIFDWEWYAIWGLMEKYAMNISELPMAPLIYSRNEKRTTVAGLIYVGLLA